MNSSTVAGVMASERLPYPLIYPFKGKGEIAIVLKHLHTEHARLSRSAQTLIQDFEGIPRPQSERLPLRLELADNELIWRTEHSLDRNRPFALFSVPGDTIRAQLSTEALDWLLYVEHRRILHRAKLLSVTRAIEALLSGLSDNHALECRLAEFGGRTLASTAAPTFQVEQLSDPAPCSTLSYAAQRRRRARRPNEIFVGRASALRNLDDLTEEISRISTAFGELREDWRPRIAVSGIGLFPGDGAMPAMRWRITNATQHGKRRRIDLTDSEATSVLCKLDPRVALRAIATESIRIDWSARALAIHGSRLAYTEYRAATEKLKTLVISC